VWSDDATLAVALAPGDLWSRLAPRAHAPAATGVPAAAGHLWHVRPFAVTQVPLAFVREVLALPSASLVLRTSSSPFAEPPGFEPAVRAALGMLARHPPPWSTRGKPFELVVDAEGAG
jgi:hypothetical protein